jgi:hypothetical protein
MSTAGGLRDQRQVVHERAPIGHVVRREDEVLAAVGEALVRPRQLDDLHRLFEGLPVGAVVLGRHLVVAERPPCRGPTPRGAPCPADAELHAPAGEHVGEGEVLGQAQRVPLRHDVEHLAEAQLLRPGGGVHPEHDEVGRHLVALVLEVVLGEPHGVVAQAVGRLRPVEHVLVAGQHVGVAVPPRRRCDARVAGVGHRHGSKKFVSTRIPERYSRAGKGPGRRP